MRFSYKNCHLNVCVIAYNVSQSTICTAWIATRGVVRVARTSQHPQDQIAMQNIIDNENEISRRNTKSGIFGQCGTRRAIIEITMGEECIGLRKAFLLLRKAFFFPIEHFTFLS